MRKRGRTPSQNLRKDDILPAIIIAFLFAVLIFIGYSIFKYKDDIKNLFNVDKTTEVEVTEDVPDLPYVLETKYIGGIGYPEVYKVPFKKSDIYKSNKQLWKDHPERVPEISKTAVDFANAYFNVNYRDIINNDEYLESFTKYMDPYWMYDEGIEEINDGEGYTMEEYADIWTQRIIDNEISMEGEFITDTSLVYVNGLYYVRGILEYTIYDSKDEYLPVTNGKTAMMIEIALHLKTDDDGFEVVYYQPVELPEGITVSLKQN